ncbi:MAG: NAD-dependent succinate-semialdehyde dehydrogenase, partial [Saprospiraceae bacterium]
AFEKWRKYPAPKRAELVYRVSEILRARKQEMGELLTREMGKVLPEALGDVQEAIDMAMYMAGEGRRLNGLLVPSELPSKWAMAVRDPLGVVAAITPWNFPIAMITRNCAPALAAGCTVVVKPSEETPLCALALAELAEQAGIPPGVFNVVTGANAPAIGKALTDSKLVRKLSFTGSTAVGKLLMAQCAPTVKKVSLELGGNAPFIVFDDADLDAAVAGAIASKYRNAGQTCVCANRIFVQTGVYEQFLEKFTVAVRAQKVGPGTEQGVSIGPLINQKAVAKVERLMADARQRGAKILTGGQAISGQFFEPTVVADVTNDMAIMQEEIFGPVAPVVRFETDEEVVRLANDTDAGLAAYFYGRDVSRCFRVAEALDYGMVGVNTGMLGTAIAPFGGMKESGIGREGSKYGIEDFLEIKYMCFGL